jgi:hypothetical protein
VRLSFSRIVSLALVTFAWIFMGTLFVSGVVQPAGEGAPEQLAGLPGAIATGPVADAGTTLSPDIVQRTENAAEADSGIVPVSELMPGRPSPVRSAALAFPRSPQSRTTFERVPSPAELRPEELGPETAAFTPAVDAPAAQLAPLLSEDDVRIAQQAAIATPLQMERGPASPGRGEIADAGLPVISPLPEAEIERLLERGEEFLRRADIVSARLLLLRAVAAGDRRAAKGVGMTYDPRVYESLSVKGPTADREVAETWYRKAGNAVFAPDLIPSDELPAQAADASSAEALQAGSPEWTAACARKYRTFVPSTGMYVARSGAKVQCQLP